MNRTSSRLAAAFFLAALSTAAAADEPFKLHLRSRREADGRVEVVERVAEWEPRKTAIIVCDMWDRHWCRSAERRVGEMAGALDATLKAARARGALVIHAPSTCTAAYEGTPQRDRARKAPHAPTPRPLASSPRWGTAWFWTDARREGVLPIDDSDGGCDCAEPCEIGAPWTRQADAIAIGPDDAITDDGQETWNLLAERGIEHVVLCGVHLNMCVLGRPFAIRQLVSLGKDVALMRDMTDTMYNPARPPGGDHFAGTERVVEHVERYWCPSFLSTDLTGAPAFRFPGAPR